jgi:hypothetical protein
MLDEHYHWYSEVGTTDTGQGTACLDRDVERNIGLPWPTAVYLVMGDGQRSTGTSIRSAHEAMITVDQSEQ